MFGLWMQNALQRYKVTLFARVHLMCIKRYKITLLVLLVDTKYIKRIQALIEKRYKIAICRALLTSHFFAIRLIA